MEWITIKAEARKQKGTRACHQLRKSALIPAILYGRKEPEELIAVNRKEFVQALNKGARLINLAISDKAEKVLIKEVQTDPVKEEPIHIDFNRIALDEMLTMEVDIVVKGHPKGIIAGGVLEQNLRRLTIKCLPTNIPSSLEIDVSHLEIGGLVRVKDIVLPAGVTGVTEPEVAVAGVHLPKVEEVAPAAEVSATEPEVITAKKPAEGEEAEAAGKEEKKGAAAKTAAPAGKPASPSGKEEKKPAQAGKEEKK